MAVINASDTCQDRLSCDYMKQLESRPYHVRPQLCASAPSPPRGFKYRVKCYLWLISQCQRCILILMVKCVLVGYFYVENLCIELIRIWVQIHLNLWLILKSFKWMKNVPKKPKVHIVFWSSTFYLIFS